MTGNRAAIAAIMGFLALNTLEAKADDSIQAIGCPSEGQMGPQPAPSSKITLSMPIADSVAKQLAYYYHDEKRLSSGVLAPRGWHCLMIYGSSGEYLIITPQSFAFPTDQNSSIPGPGIELAISLGGTSGRMQVAPIAARLFPQAKKFVAGVSAFLKDIGSPYRFATGSWPQDRIKRIRQDIVEYVTPAGAEGLGTQSWLKKGEAIRGVAILTAGNEPDLTLLSVRVPPDMAALAPVIIRQAERDHAPGVYP